MKKIIALGLAISSLAHGVTFHINNLTNRNQALIISVGNNTLYEVPLKPYEIKIIDATSMPLTGIKWTTFISEQVPYYGYREDAGPQGAPLGYTTRTGYKTWSYQLPEIAKRALANATDTSLKKIVLKDGQLFSDDKPVDGHALGLGYYYAFDEAMQALKTH